MSSPTRDWVQNYPAAVATWENAWDRFTPFLAFGPALRKVIYTTNSIESLNYQLRKIIKNRGHFPNDAAAIKLLWLAIRNIEDKRARERAKEAAAKGTPRKAPAKLVEGATIQGWKAALGELASSTPTASTATCNPTQTSTSYTDNLTGPQERRPGLATGGEPTLVNVHDFKDPDSGKANPYGVYDIAANTGWVSVGSDHDTAAFAVETIASWSPPTSACPARSTCWAQARRLRPASAACSKPNSLLGRGGASRPALGHQQMEQDRAPNVLPHCGELARATAGGAIR